MIGCRIMYHGKQWTDIRNLNLIFSSFVIIRLSVQCSLQFYYLLLVFSLVYSSWCCSKHFSRIYIRNILASVSSNSYQQWWAINFNSTYIVVPSPTSHSFCFLVSHISWNSKLSGIGLFDFITLMTLTFCFDWIAAINS